VNLKDSLELGKGAVVLLRTRTPNGIYLQEIVMLLRRSRAWLDANAHDRRADSSPQVWKLTQHQLKTAP
jgi:hypothetical protein